MTLTIEVYQLVIIMVVMGVIGVMIAWNTPVEMKYSKKDRARKEQVLGSKRALLAAEAVRQRAIHQLIADYDAKHAVS